MGRGKPTTTRYPDPYTELECLLEAKNERIAELEADIILSEQETKDMTDFRDNWVAKCAELEAKLDAVRKCQRYTACSGRLEECHATTQQEWMDGDCPHCSPSRIEELEHTRKQRNVAWERIEQLQKALGDT